LRGEAQMQRLPAADSRGVPSVDMQRHA
jgi:hypothetical protein